MESAGCGGLLIIARDSRDPDLAPFVGTAHLGGSFLLAGPDAPPSLGFLTRMEREEVASTGHALLDPEELGVRELVEAGTPPGEFWAELLARAFAAAGWEPMTVALAGHSGSGTAHEACRRLEERGWSFVSGSQVVRGLRRTKPREQLEDVRRAADGVRVAMRAVARMLAEAEASAEGLVHAGRPLTAGRLRERIAATFAAHGLEQPERNIVAAGAEAGVPHTRGASDRVLQAGESLVVDLFPRSRLFADCTRTFCVGEPPPELARAHAEVEAALRAAHEQARPGVSGWELQKATCQRFEAAGYRTPLSHPGTERGYVHSLGHGVGFELHELPTFRRDAAEAGLLAEGDLFTLEPGLYEPEPEHGAFGVRLEDLCFLGPDGLENLTPLPYALDPNAW